MTEDNDGTAMFCTSHKKRNEMHLISTYLHKRKAIKT